MREQSIPFFFKQWGGVNKGKAGRVLGGRTYDEFPTIPMDRGTDRNSRKDMFEDLVQLAV